MELRVYVNEELISLSGKALPANTGDARDVGLITGSGRFPGGGNGTPVQYSCLENSLGREAWQATVHGATKGRHNWVTEHIQTSMKEMKIFYPSHIEDYNPGMASQKTLRTVLPIKNQSPIK